MRRSHVLCAAGIAMLASAGFAQQAPTSDGPYKIVKSDKVGGVGGFDYVYADVDGRRLYIPRSAGGGRGGRGGGGGGAPAAAPAPGAAATGSRVDVYDLDTLAPVGSIPNTNGVHGAAVDPKSHHGFASSNPVVMWDTTDLKTLKTIKTEGSPDGILFEPFSERVFVFSHGQPNATVIDATSGDIVGTMDLGGAPEQAQSDGAGHMYVDLEDQNAIAVVDPKAMKVTATYALGDKGEGPGGLGLDIKNHILFAMCSSQNCVILNADDGKIITTLPIGNGVDGGAFNPNTMEAFSSQGDATLTIIKENSPTSFVVEQTLKTMSRAKCCTLDTKTNRLVLTATDLSGAVTQPAPPAGGPPAGGGGRGGRGGRGGQAPPNSFTILLVGK